MAIKNRKVEKIKHPSILFATYWKHNTEIWQFFFSFLKKLVTRKPDKHFFSTKNNQYPKKKLLQV
jgi:hypothetical protein